MAAVGVLPPVHLQPRVVHLRGGMMVATVVLLLVVGVLLMALLWWLCSW